MEAYTNQDRKKVKVKHLNGYKFSQRCHMRKREDEEEISLIT